MLNLQNIRRRLKISGENFEQILKRNFRRPRLNFDIDFANSQLGGGRIMETLKDKIALVAGGAGAVGEGIVGKFLETGARVVVPSRSREKLDLLKEKFAAYAENLTLIVEDVGAETGAALVRDCVLQKFGRLDAVVASVGGWWQGLPLVNVPLETWNEVLKNNLTAHFTVAKSFLPVLLHQNCGSYIFIAGQGGVVPVPQSLPVSVAVAGEIMLAKGLHAENKNSKVRINTLVLGVVNTRERRGYAQSDWITAEDVGEFAARLAAGENFAVRSETINLFDKKGLQKAFEKLI
jgi:NAD(P)-dependent dehydrogenase (short-subunit alcohol dehydrogenase family)